MIRPCILVLDPEAPGSISTRKLVIETAKFNVLSTYSGAELLETLRRFPNVDAAVLNVAGPSLDQLTCEEISRRIAELSPKLPVIVTSSSGMEVCGPNQTGVRSFDPGSLLETLRQMFPVATAQISDQEKLLHLKMEQSED